MGSLYVDYKPGTLNVILVAPHGGRLRPQEMPDRKPTGKYSHFRYCVEPDWRTLQAVERIREHLCDLTGKYPYFIANLLDRSILDPNREIEEATFGHPTTVANYEFYHNSIEQAKKELENNPEYTGTLIVDIHGQSHSHGLTELGYALTASQIDNCSYSLSQDGTIRCAASNSLNSDNHSALISGELSLGKFLEDAGVQCLPSPANAKISNRTYFNGGFTVRSHFSEKADAIQIELSRDLRSTDSPTLNENMLKVAKGIKDFCQTHYTAKNVANAP